MSADEGKNCISYWLPPLLKVGSLNIPETEIVRAECDMFFLLDSPADTSEAQAYAQLQLVNDLQQAIGAVGTPCFFRTGHTSAKHDWRMTCLLPDRESVADHLWRLVECSSLCGMMGLPTEVFAVRRLLKTEPVFYAFRGRMPITKEFRLFIRKGEIEHIQSYWPPGAMRGPFYLPNGLEASLAEVWELLRPLGELNSYDQSGLEWCCEEIGKIHPEYWSVDFLWAEDKWWLTDMALGENSFKWDGNFDGSIAEERQEEQEVEDVQSPLFGKDE